MMNAESRMWNEVTVAALIISNWRGETGHGLRIYISLFNSELGGK
jgi:hypothetical protein